MASTSTKNKRRKDNRSSIQPPTESGRLSRSSSKTKPKHDGNKFITLGLLIILATLVFGNSNTLLSIFYPPQPVVLAKSEVTDTATTPTVINFQQQQVEIPITAGTFENEEWTKSDNSALYFNQSGKLGQNGNVVIYGHNTKPVFEILNKVKVNNTLVLKDSEGKEFIYKVSQTKTVSPIDVHILEQDNKREKLTLFTCIGLFDSMRLVVTAERVS